MQLPFLSSVTHPGHLMTGQDEAGLYLEGECNPRETAGWWQRRGRDRTQNTYHGAAGCVAGSAQSQPHRLNACSMASHARGLPRLPLMLTVAPTATIAGAFSTLTHPTPTPTQGNSRPGALYSSPRFRRCSWRTLTPRLPGD